MRQPCKNCPWVDRDDEMNTLEQKQSGRIVVAKILGHQVQACHMITGEMIPASEDEICIGHLQHLSQKVV